MGELAQLHQLQEELVEASEELQDAPKSCVVCGPWRRKEEILPLLTEEGGGKEVVEEPQKHNLHLPSPNPVHILLTPVAPVMVLIRDDLLDYLPTPFSGKSSCEIPVATMFVFQKIHVMNSHLISRLPGCI